jgi:hypothetical protein
MPRISVRPATPPAWRGLAAILAAAMIAVILLLGGPAPRALAASCNGASHVPSLAAGTVSPGSGGPSTDFDFAVQYSDTAGCAPSSVVVVISGVGPVSMTASGSGWNAGVTFTVSRNLATGSYAYSFSATSGTGNGTKTVTLSSVSPGTIVVAPAPTPKPKPTPKPTTKPKPKPAATARPRSTTKPRPKPTQASIATPGATPDPTSTRMAAFEPDPTASQPPIAIALGPDPIDRGGPSVGSSGPSLPGGVGGGPFDQFPWLWSVLLTAFSAIVGIALFIWLASRRPRRRYAELGPGPMDPRDMVSPMPELPAGAALVATVAAATPETPYGEMEMPRWRRPSLQAARKASTRDIPDHVPMVFAAAAGATEQRARVTYRLVRVYDQPDEVRGTEVAWLDRGDEVDVVAQQGSYTFVRTPSGAAGWVHKTTLRAIKVDEDEGAIGGSGPGEDDPPSWSIIH